MVRKQCPVLELANQMPVRNMDLTRAPRRTARKKGSGYENGLEACIFEIIALNQKNLLNLLTNFLRSVQIHKGPTSDIGTLNRYVFVF